jgi:hypothetical protein
MVLSVVVCLCVCVCVWVCIVDGAHGLHLRIPLPPLSSSRLRSQPNQLTRYGIQCQIPSKRKARPLTTEEAVDQRPHPFKWSASPADVKLGVCMCVCFVFRCGAVFVAPSKPLLRPLVAAVNVVPICSPIENPTPPLLISCCVADREKKCLGRCVLRRRRCSVKCVHAHEARSLFFVLTISPSSTLFDRFLVVLPCRLPSFPPALVLFLAFTKCTHVRTHMQRKECHGLI